MRWGRMRATDDTCASAFIMAATVSGEGASGAVPESAWARRTNGRKLAGKRRRTVSSKDARVGY